MQGLARTSARGSLSVGVTNDSMERVDALVEAGVDAIVIDTAHGHSRGVVGVLKAVKEKYPHIDVVVGNIATCSRSCKNISLRTEPTASRWA